MKFFVKDNPSVQNFSLIYDEEDYSFDVEPFNVSGFTSISINDLQLEIDEDGSVIYVWGYCPLINFQEVKHFPENYKRHTLVARLERAPVPGVGIGLNKKNWPIFINKPKGWVCLGNPNAKGDQMVEFAPNCVAVLENQEIIAVWLHPEGLPKFSQ